MSHLLGRLKIFTKLRIVCCLIIWSTMRMKWTKIELFVEICPPPNPNSLALIAQSHFTPPLPSNHAYVEEQNTSTTLNQTLQTNSPNQLITYVSTQQTYASQYDSYDNTDSMYYSNSTNDEDDEEFNYLNQGIALIARAFNKFSNRSNNRLHSSSNTRNQAVVQDGRVEVQNRNYGRSNSGGYMGN